MKTKPQNNDSVWTLMGLSVLLLVGSVLAMVITNFVWLVVGVPLAVLLFIFAIWKGGQ